MKNKESVSRLRMKKIMRQYLRAKRKDFNEAKLKICFKCGNPSNNTKYCIRIS
jgi:hypothetical protein